MHSKLRETFDAFFKKAQSRLWPSENAPIKRPLELARNRGLLLEMVDELEQSIEFNYLVRKTIKELEKFGKRNYLNALIWKKVH